MTVTANTKLVADKVGDFHLTDLVAGETRITIASCQPEMLACIIRERAMDLTRAELDALITELTALRDVVNIATATA